MVAANEPRYGTRTEPPCPLPPDLRSDVAQRLATGSSWYAVASCLNYHDNALRYAAENDPDFHAAQARAQAEAIWEAEAKAIQRLSQLANGCDDTLALRAAEELLLHARERRHDETKIAVEKLRVEVQQAKLAANAPKEAETEPEPPAPKYVFPERTEEERATDAAAEPYSLVYVWGGQHPLSVGVHPDATDKRVRIQRDWSLVDKLVYWAVPEEDFPAGTPLPEFIKPREVMEEDESGTDHR